MAELTKQELYAHVGADEVQAEHIEKPQLSYWKDVVRRFFSNKVAILSVAVLAVLIVMAIVGPFLSPYNYRTTDVASVSDKLAEVGREALGPDREHWFGVDTLGRDLWARVWMGTRYSLMIGFVAAIVQAIRSNNDGFMLQQLRRAAKNILYNDANSSMMNGIGNNTRIVKIIPWWQPALRGVTIGVSVVTGLAVLAMLAAKLAYYKKQKGAEKK